MSPIEVRGHVQTDEEKQMFRKFLPRYSTYKNIVQKILGECEPARGSDRRLIREVMFYCESNQLPIPSFETITRARRRFNEAGMFLPPLRVRDKRREKEKMFRHSSREGLI